TAVDPRRVGEAASLGYSCLKEASVVAGHASVHRLNFSGRQGAEYSQGEPRLELEPRINLVLQWRARTRHDNGTRRCIDCELDAVSLCQRLEDIREQPRTN